MSSEEANKVPPTYNILENDEYESLLDLKRNYDSVLNDSVANRRALAEAEESVEILQSYLQESEESNTILANEVENLSGQNSRMRANIEAYQDALQNFNSIESVIFPVLKIQNYQEIEESPEETLSGAMLSEPDYDRFILEERLAETKDKLRNLRTFIFGADSARKLEEIDGYEK